MHNDATPISGLSGLTDHDMIVRMMGEIVRMSRSIDKSDDLREGDADRFTKIALSLQEQQARLAQQDIEISRTRQANDTIAAIAREADRRAELATRAIEEAQRQTQMYRADSEARDKTIAEQAAAYAKAMADVATKAIEEAQRQVERYKTDSEARDTAIADQAAEQAKIAAEQTAEHAKALEALNGTIGTWTIYLRVAAGAWGLLCLMLLPIIVEALKRLLLP